MSMRCREIRNLMTKQQSEPLAPEQVGLLEGHLASCGACRKESKEMAEFVARLSEAAAIPVSAPLLRPPDTGAVLARSQRDLRRTGLSWRIAALGLGSTAVLAVAFVLAKRPDRVPAVAPRQAFVVGPKRSGVKVAGGLKPSGTGETASTGANGYPDIVRHGEQTPRKRVAGSGLHRPAIWPPTYEGPPELMPGWKETPQDDLAYLNPDATVQTGILRWPSDDVLKMQARLEQSVKGGDDFVSVPPPSLASGDERAIRAATEAYRQERAIVDPRLVRKVTLAVKGTAFSEICRRLTQETGIQISANRRVADDKITLFCKERPLRDLMRQISTLFNFTWNRTGKEGAYEYELTQSLRSQLLEETLRQKDRDEMLLELDRQMAQYRPYLGMSRADLAEKMKELGPKIKDRTIFEEYNRLSLLSRGGFAGLNLFFRLSQRELDALKAGEKLTWDLRADNLGLPPAFVSNAQEAMEESTGPLHPGEKQPGNKLEATLRLEVSRDGAYTLRAGLYGERGGTEAPLANAKSPSADKKRLDNATENMKLAGDADLQGKVSLKLKEASRLEMPPFPDTEFAYIEKTGPKVTTADVLEAIHNVTGKDMIGDYFSRLHAPNAVSVESVKLFDALSRSCDAMNVRWGKGEGWLTFRSPDYYYARPQEVPHHTLAHWAEVRNRNGVLGPEEFAEIAELTDVQLDSVTTAQAAVALYGLMEWPVASVKEARPLWRFYARLSRGLRSDALSEKGVAFVNLSPTLKRQYIELARCAENGVWPSETDMKDARLRVIYTPENNIFSQKKPANALLPAGNTVVFLFSSGQPFRYSAAGPFNGIYGLSQPMLDQRLSRPRAD
jgi:predicted anti-sigma-YlaC factor YlaD